MIVAPKGASESSPILNACLPSGIPIIVMQRINPANKNKRQFTNPPTSSQIKLAIGWEPKFVLTVFPNGVNTNLANLNNCNPNGIPIMVMQKISPVKAYPKAVQSPINKNQIIFAIVFKKIPPLLS